MQEIGSGYDGTLSPLTRYGTLNVSTARIPRKKRGKGNAHLRRDRVTAKGFAPTEEGRELAQDGIASVKVTYADGTSETRTVSSFRKGREHSQPRRRVNTAPQSEMLRLAHIVGYTGDQNH